MTGPSWWDGLYKRLVQRGIPAGFAKMIARHIRADFKPFAEEFLETTGHVADAQCFRDVFLTRRRRS